MRFWEVEVLILIIGGGIGGLTLALNLHRVGIPCQIFESAKKIKPLGVGLNILPHAMRELSLLGLESNIAKDAIETQDVSFYNKFGQHIFTEARGRFAGYGWPQYSIHRASLHDVLMKAVCDRLGPDAIMTGHRFRELEQSNEGVVAYFDNEEGSCSGVKAYRGSAIVGCDGIKSVVRSSFYEKNDPLIYSGITMWRGITKWPPFLSGSSMVYAGWLETGKVIAYPISKTDDGMHIVNWLCEFYCPPRNPKGDWGQKGRIEDFIWSCKEMKFSWLNIPEMIAAAEFILEYPMVDKEPIKQWSFGRVTLLGDAAHPMYPRGSNGAGQSIIDARCLADNLASEFDAVTAFKKYETDRRPKTTAIVHANRSNPPDAILREVYERTGDKPFKKITDVVSVEELEALSEQYKKIAGFKLEAVHNKKSPM